MEMGKVLIYSTESVFVRLAFRLGLANIFAPKKCLSGATKTKSIHDLLPASLRLTQSERRLINGFSGSFNIKCGRFMSIIEHYQLGFRFHRRAARDWFSARRHNSRDRKSQEEWTSSESINTFRFRVKRANEKAKVLHHRGGHGIALHSASDNEVKTLICQTTKFRYATKQEEEKRPKHGISDARLRNLMRLDDCLVRRHFRAEKSFKLSFNFWSASRTLRWWMAHRESTKRRHPKPVCSASNYALRFCSSEEKTLPDVNVNEVRMKISARLPLTALGCRSCITLSQSSHAQTLQRAQVYEYMSRTTGWIIHDKMNLDYSWVRTRIQRNKIYKFFICFPSETPTQSKQHATSYWKKVEAGLLFGVFRSLRWAVYHRRPKVFICCITKSSQFNHKTPKHVCGEFKKKTSPASPRQTLCGARHDNVSQFAEQFHKFFG